MTERGEESESSEQGNGRGDDELLPEDVDRRFNELIRGLAAERVEEEPEPAAPPPEPAPEEPTLLELWDAELPEDEEDEYVPPEPPPLLWPSLQAVGGILLIIAGVALVVNPGLAPLGANPGRLVGFVAFLGGVWLLISRLRPDRDADDTDDGAVV